MKDNRADLIIEPINGIGPDPSGLNSIQQNSVGRFTISDSDDSPVQERRVGLRRSARPSKQVAKKTRKRSSRK